MRSGSVARGLILFLRTRVVDLRRWTVHNGGADLQTPVYLVPLCRQHKRPRFCHLAYTISFWGVEGHCILHIARGCGLGFNRSALPENMEMVTLRIKDEGAIIVTEHVSTVAKNAIL